MTIVKHPIAVRHESDRLDHSHIRRGTAADATALSAFATQTFIDTYADYPDPRNLRQYAVDAFAPARQAQELTDTQAITLLAYRHDALCGFAQVRQGPAPHCVPDGTSIELHRLYVDRRWHGSGVAQELLAQVHCAAIASGSATLWLKVWERNTRAIAFYRKSGFVDVGVADFFVRHDRLTDRVFVMPPSPS